MIDTCIPCEMIAIFKLIHAYISSFFFYGVEGTLTIYSQQISSIQYRIINYSHHDTYRTIITLDPQDLIILQLKIYTI